MALKKQMCCNHPDRTAIGICVMTKKPICSECSTRYEGVNYSKEGLRLLKEQRSRSENKTGILGYMLLVIGVLSVPLFIYLMYRYYLLGATSLIDLAQMRL